MPKKIYRKKTHKRVPAKRRTYRRRRATINVNRALQPVAQRTIVKMKYSEVYAPTFTGNQTAWRLNLNSIFDPNITGGGHQPYGHDTFASLYNRYRVISCSYIISAYATGTNTFQVAALPANQTFIASFLDEYRENPRCKYMIQSAGGGTRMLKGRVYLPSLVGRNRAQYMADDRYSAVFGTSPAELAVLNISGSNFGQTSGVDPGITYNVTLVYTVECFDVKNLSQS